MNSNKTILIVENVEAQVNKLKTVLGGVYNIEVIDSPTEALTLIGDSPEYYSLVMININLPVINGYEFCYTVKKDLGIINLPIVITGNFIDFKNFDIPEGLRATDYDKIKIPFNNKLVSDIVEVNIEKKMMLDRLAQKGKIEEQTFMSSMTYFQELLDLELLRAQRLDTTLNVISIKTYNEEIKENLMSVIQNTCRQTDVSCISEETIYLLLPNSKDIEGEMIVNRFNSVIYGLQIQRYFFSSAKTDIEEFKLDMWGHSVISFQS